ncbi:hypothetical protein [Kribbella amoyensis]|uniref:hypothetical protein n=1 Tax=Kribbella amoyensis TaxID=996641 RepID=UPI00119DB67C|nr:hypothetical protein [Kribbella amoyensis]
MAKQRRVWIELTIPLMTGEPTVSSADLLQAFLDACDELMLDLYEPVLGPDLQPLRSELRRASAVLVGPLSSDAASPEPTEGQA